MGGFFTGNLWFFLFFGGGPRVSYGFVWFFTGNLWETALLGGGIENHQIICDGPNFDSANEFKWHPDATVQLLDESFKVVLQMIHL